MSNQVTTMKHLFDNACRQFWILAISIGFGLQLQGFASAQETGAVPNEASASSDAAAADTQEKPSDKELASEPDKRPNIVVIIADDLGYGETGMMGNDEIPTPNIDALAAAGVRCTSGYVTASYCSASRAGLFTGRYQSRFGYEMNPTGKLD